MKLNVRCLLGLLVAGSVLQGQIKSVPPLSGPPAGPFSPDVIADGYLYVSGQGAKNAQGVLPETFEAQMRQALENVTGIVEAGGLTLDHLVYAHLYLEDMTKLPEADRIWSAYFAKDPPARATIGVARLPGTPLEINAVAAVNLEGRKAVSIAGFEGKPYPAGVLTRDRLFISSVTGSGATPEEEVASALDALKAVNEAAGLTLKHMVFVNPYLTAGMPAETMNREYGKRFEFGNTPARATIFVSELPKTLRKTGAVPGGIGNSSPDRGPASAPFAQAGSHVAFTGVAVRDLSTRQAVRPKNMAPSPTASPCVFAGKTLYCSAKSGFIPGPHTGIYAATMEHQLRQTFRNLLDNLEEAGLDFKSVAAATVYLDNMEEFGAMNKIYTEYFSESSKPARTTVQQMKPGSREPDAEGRYPTLEQISLIAVR